MLICLCFIGIIIPYSNIAASYYVSPAGNNANSGLSLANAFRTLQRAANMVIAGDQVFVADSTYAGFDLRTSGTATNPIVFQAIGNQVIINRRNGVTTDGINIENAHWIEIRGFRVINQPRAGIRVVLANHVTIRNNICLNNQRWGIFTGFTDDFLAEFNECANSVLEHGIYVSNSSDRAIIRNNISHHNRAAGLHFNGDISQGGDGINHDPQVYNNIIYRNGLGGGSAINMDGNQNALIYNNLLYDNHATGIALYQIDGGGPSTGASIFQNTIVQDPNSRWAILLTNGATGANIKNNIIINQHATRGSINVFPDSRASLSSDYNIMTNRFTLTDGGSNIDSTAWKGLGYDLHSYFSPSLSNLFVNYAGANFNIAAGSKAINFGIGGLGISTDLYGNARVQSTAPDAGAIESAFASLPLHWLRYFVRQSGHRIHIQGTIAGMEMNASVCLEKWNKNIQKYYTLDCRNIPSQVGSVTVTFDQSNTPGPHQFRLIATEENGKVYWTKPMVIITNQEASIVYPNPTRGIIYITQRPDSENTWISIRDLSGKILIANQKGHEFDLTLFQQGVYYITLTSKDMPSITHTILKL